MLLRLVVYNKLSAPTDDVGYVYTTCYRRKGKGENPRTHTRSLSYARSVELVGVVIIDDFAKPVPFERRRTREARRRRRIVEHKPEVSDSRVETIISSIGYYERGCSFVETRSFIRIHK